MKSAEVVTADFNGDRKPDLTVARDDSSNITTLLGRGDGTFDPPRNIGILGQARGLAVGDFNGDGRKDLVAGVGASGVTAFLGNGDGTFQRVSFDPGEDARFIAVDDFNGDGRQDLALALSTQGVVGIQLGNGDGTFQPMVTFPGGNLIASIVVGDFNGDGKRDLATANTNSDNVSVLLGAGDGTFLAMVNYAVPLPSGIAVGDLDQDGKQDLVVAGAGVFALLGNGDGTFLAPVDYGGGTNSVSIAVNDLNGDFLQDIVVSQTGKLTVLLGSGDGAFQSPVGTSLYLGGPLVSEDLDDDGRADVAVARYEDGLAIGLNSCLISCPVTTPVADRSFEAGFPWPSWTTQTSTNFGSPLCHPAFCGTGGGTALPYDGSNWAWFGGISAATETATVGQRVVLPTSADLKLRFHMWIGYVSGVDSDSLTVTVDGAGVRQFLEPMTAEASYSLREVDLTPFADGKAHEIGFLYRHPHPGVANFSVDSIGIVNCLPLTKRGMQITYLPFTIRTQGGYHIAQNFSTSITSGAAIRIKADFVTLDLKGFKVGGGGAGPATSAKGVHAQNRKNLTIRNGSIRGFFQGILLEGAGGGNHLVENVRLDGNTYAGIWVEGSGNSVRRNQVLSTSGTTLGTDPDAFGIVAHGSAAKILDNDVTDTFGMGTGTGHGIQLNAGSGSIVERNRVSNSIASVSRGIEVLGSTNALVSNNRLLKLDLGLFFDSPSGGKFKNNLSSGVIAPYTGGIDAGNNQ